MATAAAAAVARAKRLIQHHFFAADAVRPDRAIDFDPGFGPEARIFERYRRDGIVHEASPGRYWLDLPAYDRMLQERFSRVRLALVAVVLSLMLILVVASSGIAR